MRAPEVRVEVTGTTLAVIREPQGTCVCVLEGAVRMGGPREPMATVPHGHLRYVFGDEASGPADLTLKGDLAESWQASADPMLSTLRPFG